MTEVAAMQAAELAAIHAYWSAANYLFTRETHVVFSFHGYPGAIHKLLHGRANPTRFHVRGYEEEGTTTTPFDMVVLNETSRYHICMDAIRRSKRPLPDAHERTADCLKMLERQSVYPAEQLEDLPEISGWVWPHG